MKKREAPQKKITKELKQFKTSPSPVKLSGGHNTMLFQKIKEKIPVNDTIWFGKRAYSLKEPIDLEIIAGELYRLFIGIYQTKTRYVKDDASDKALPFVASEGVKGFKDFRELKDNLSENLKDYNGLASIFVVSMLLAETDLKADNMGINSEGKIVKIDHDSSFWPLLLEITNDQGANLNKTHFTLYDLEHVLKPETYKVAAWGEFIPAQLKQTIGEDKEFQNAVYFTILKMLICPFEVIDIILSVNLLEREQRGLYKSISLFLIERLALLKSEIMQSPRFRDFIANAAIETVKIDLESFLANSKRYKEQCDIDTLLLKIDNNIESLQAEVELLEANTSPSYSTKSS